MALQSYKELLNVGATNGFNCHVNQPQKKDDLMKNSQALITNTMNITVVVLQANDKLATEKFWDKIHVALVGIFRIKLKLKAV